MTMEIYFAVCAGIVTLCSILASAVLIMTLLQLHKAATAVERLAKGVEHRVHTVFDTLENIAGLFKSKWMRAAEFLYAGFKGFRGQSDASKASAGTSDPFAG